MLWRHPQKRDGKEKKKNHWLSLDMAEMMIHPNAMPLERPPSLLMSRILVKVMIYASKPEAACISLLNGD